MENRETLLSVLDLTVEIPGALGERRIGLRRVSLDLMAGEILVLAGESGSGKTLLARLVAGTADPRAKVLGGTLGFGGRTFAATKRRHGLALRRGEVTVIPGLETAPPDPDQSVADWLAVCRCLPKRRDAGWRDGFHNVGLHDPDRLLPRRLGDLPPLVLKRLAVARSLFVGSRLIVAEEIGSDLDPAAASDFFELLARIRDEHGTAILATTGTPDGWERIADRVALFFEGGLLEVAPPDHLLSAPAFAYTREFFAGRPRLGDLARDLPTIGREAVREAEEAVGQSE